MTSSASLRILSVVLQPEQKRLDEPRLIGHRILALVNVLADQRRLNHRLDVPPVDLTVVQELQALSNDGVPHADHMLGQVLHQAQEAALRVEPGVRAQLLVVRLQGLDDAADAELVVALRAVQRTDDQVDDAQVEDLAIRIVISHMLLLLLDLAHELLGLLVLAGHDVAHAEVGEHDSRHVEDGVEVLLDDGLVEACRLLELVLLHEEDVGHVKLPDVGLAAELHALPEYLLHLGVLVQVPVDLGLNHKISNTWNDSKLLMRQLS